MFVSLGERGGERGGETRKRKRKARNECAFGGESAASMQSLLVWVLEMLKDMTEQFTSLPPEEAMGRGGLLWLIR